MLFDISKINYLYTEYVSYISITVSGVTMCCYTLNYYTSQVLSYIDDNTTLQYSNLTALLFISIQHIEKISQSLKTKSFFPFPI